MSQNQNPTNIASVCKVCVWSVIFRKKYFHINQDQTFLQVSHCLSWTGKHGDEFDSVCCCKHHGRGKNSPWFAPTYLAFGEHLTQQLIASSSSHKAMIFPAYLKGVCGANRYVENFMYYYAVQPWRPPCSPRKREWIHSFA